MNLSEFLTAQVNFSNDEIEEIISPFKKEEISKGHNQVLRGQICHKLYSLEQGTGRNYYLNSEGKKIIQLFNGKGRFVCSLENLAMLILAISGFSLKEWINLFNNYSIV